MKNLTSGNFNLRLMRLHLHLRKFYTFSYMKKNKQGKFSQNNLNLLRCLLCWLFRIFLGVFVNIWNGGLNKGSHLFSI